MITLFVLLGALSVSSCGGSSSPRKISSNNQCTATLGFEGPIGNPLGREQLGFVKLAVSNDNARNGTAIRLAVADTRSGVPETTAVSGLLIAQPRIVAVIGPAGDREVEAVGPMFGRAGLAFISASATASALTDGANPTFFRVVPAEALQGPQEARFVISHLRPRALLVIGNRSAYSSELVQSMLPVFRAARIGVDQAVTTGPGSGALVPILARITAPTSVVVLAWDLAPGAQAVGRSLVEQHMTLTIVGPDHLFAPGVFTIPGSYITAYGPDITALPNDASIARRARQTVGMFGIAGPTAYAATHVLDQAIAATCRSGQTPSRSNVLAAIRKTNEPTSILGTPIRFSPSGDMADARWFLFRIGTRGRYHLLTGP